MRDLIAIVVGVILTALVSALVLVWWLACITAALTMGVAAELVHRWDQRRLVCRRRAS